MTLTIAEVCEVSGVKQQTLLNRISSELIEPTIRGGVGRGKGHEFSVTQVVGICVAEEVLRSEHKCALSFVGVTVEAFGNVTESWLIRKFKEGDRFYLQPHYGKPLLSGDHRYGWPNAEKALKTVLAHEEQKGKR